ncbi:hypothetical protein C8R44DRAFT_870578 [Mycena epipterygia]|nr:hypothetical protein C8R44DRAFT_870578 [Mycena epipterygia]
MSPSSNVDVLQEKDIVVAIQEFADDAFVLKRDLEATKIQLSTVMPDMRFEPYDIFGEFIQSEQTVATTVRTVVIQGFRNVVDAAEDADCFVPEKAEEATAYLNALGKEDFTVETNKKSAAFEAALHRLFQALDSNIAELNEKASDDSKLAALSKELAVLKEKKKVAESKVCTTLSRHASSLGSLLNKEVFSEALAAGNESYQQQGKSGKVPAKNPLESWGGKVKKLGDKLPDAPDHSAISKEIDVLSSQIDKLQEQIHVLQAEKQRAARSVGQEAEIQESLAKYGGRFKVVAANLDKLKQVPKAAQIYVQDWQSFLGTGAAQDKLQLKEHTALLRARNQMFASIHTALTGFISRRV